MGQEVEADTLGDEFKVTLMTIKPRLSQVLLLMRLDICYRDHSDLFLALALESFSLDEK